jgi:hypothetical protein
VFLLLRAPWCNAGLLDDVSHHVMLGRFGANGIGCRSISDAGFAELRRQLEYKSVVTGASVVVPDRFFPSSKTCSKCGTIHDIKLCDRVMVCDCGNAMDRDLNAAMNLKNKAVSYIASACRDKSSDRGRKSTEYDETSLCEAGSDFIRFCVTV